MKWLLPVLLFCMPRPAFNQNLLDSIPFDTSGYAKYEAVIETSGTKADLFNKGKAWFTASFKEINLVVQKEDTATGTLIGNGNLTYAFIYTSQTKKSKLISYPANGKASFTLKLFFKDGKFKYIISNIKTSNDLSYFSTDADFYKPTVEAAITGKESAAGINLYSGLNNAIHKIIDSLTKAMTLKGESDF